jgi:DNA-binding NarL/FixJ family response regulator
MRILIADDNDRVRDGIRAILNNEDGFEVCGEAADGAQALDKTRELSPDLVLLDIHMPSSDGFAVARKMRLEFPKVKVLIMSQSDADMMLPSALHSGAAGCIDKTSLATALASRIRDLLKPD